MILLYMAYIHTYILICDQYLIIAKINPLRSACSLKNPHNSAWMPVCSAVGVIDCKFDFVKVIGQ